MPAFDVFVLVSGVFSILTSIPLVYLAQRSYRDARELHRVQREVAEVVAEIGDLQREIHSDQRRARTDIVRTKEKVEQVAAATARRRRLPRVQVRVER
jgi:cell division protein FtsL